MGRRKSEVIAPCPECGKDFIHITIGGHKHLLCESCRKPMCMICGTRVPLDRGLKKTCSDGCAIIVKRQKSMRGNARFAAKHPEKQKEKWEKIRSDPKLLEEYRENDRERNRLRRALDENYAQKHKELAKDWRGRNPEKDAEYRANRRLRMGEDKYREWQERKNQKEGERRKKMLKELKNDPEQYQKYLESEREQRRQRDRQKYLHDLSKDLEKLKDNTDE